MRLMQLPKTAAHHRERYQNEIKKTQAMTLFSIIKLLRVLLATLAVAFSGSAFAVDQPPNVVFILSDDQAWMDYGFMGHPDIKTPHLDKLSEKSLLFERGYVASPLCRPSLASMVTGLYPFQHGITANDVDGSNNRAELDVPVRMAFHKLPSFIKLLTANGYLAHQSGKWWEGSFREGGFTHGMTHGDPERGGRHGDAGLSIGRKGMDPVTDFIDLAIAEKKPFLLWYAPFLPHTPHNPPERLLKKYTQPGRAADVAKYYAMCEWFDETCGELLDYLDEKQLTENTMVVYICDNGWAPTSTNLDQPYEEMPKSYALRSKTSPYENGIRTPIMISWPVTVKPGTVTDFAHAIDLFPTIAAAAGLSAPADLPGINLLDENAREDREIVFGVCHSSHNMRLGFPDETLQYLWCVEGDWKLLLRYFGKDTTRYRVFHAWDTAKVRLYNLKEDPHERNDLATSHPDIVERLKSKIEAWHPVDEN
jgi:arylsulfatase A-like enzyme